MTGTYQGTYHGGNDFTGQSVQSVHETLKTNAILNGSTLAFVTNGWQPAGFSLSVPGGGTSRVPTSGPGASGSGAAPSGGPGSGSVGGGGFAGTGPGGGTVRVGGAMGGAHLLPMLDPKKVTVQPVTVGGFDVRTDRGYSDAGDIEQRYGESEIGTPAWFYSWIVTGADGWKTFVDTSPVGQQVIKPAADAMHSAMEWDRSWTRGVKSVLDTVLTDGGGTYYKPTGPTVIDKPAFGQTFDPAQW